MPKEDDADLDKGKGEKMFSQAELNEKIDERLKRERAKYADYEELKAKADQFDKVGDQAKGDTEKLSEQLSAVQKELADERLRRIKSEVAASKGLTPAHMKRLSGSTLEELEDSADELLADFPVTEKKDEETDGDGKGSPKPPPSSRPKPDLKGGLDPTTSGPTETDPAKLAANVPRF